MRTFAGIGQIFFRLGSRADLLKHVSNTYQVVVEYLPCHVQEPEHG